MKTQARKPGTITCLCCYEPDMTHIDAEGCFCECHLPGGSNVGRCGEMLSDSRPVLDTSRPRSVIDFYNSTQTSMRTPAEVATIGHRLGCDGWWWWRNHDLQSGPWVSERSARIDAVKTLNAAGLSEYLQAQKGEE